MMDDAVEHHLKNDTIYLDQILHTSYFLHCPATGMQSGGEA